jgi:hypothetical protein
MGIGATRAALQPWSDMKFTIDRATLERLVKQVNHVPRLRLWACAARVFVGAKHITAGTEALVFNDGGCTVPRQRFLDAIEYFGYKKKSCITVEADNKFLRIGKVSIPCRNYSNQVTAPAEFPVFPVTDTWIVANQGPNASER